MSYSPKAADVAKLRNATGAGMMDSKKALVEAEGDFDKAVELLRKKGQKVAANRADRENLEGAAIAAVNSDNTKAAIIKLSCETDFVAKNEDFVKLATEFANLALNFSNKEDLLASDFHGIPVSEKLIEQTGVIGEKIEISEFKIIEAPFVGAYIHAGNKIAAAVGLSKVIDNAAEVAKNVSMQVAAMNPIALDESKVDSSVIEKELEIAKDQLRQEGKPENMLENIAKGKLNKFFKDNTLVKQDYIMGEKISVEDYVKSIDPEVKITEFIRI
ncbi:elongation factor Ts [Apibacter muscae]|uniref:Elongation factor Ts n=1 Tax=Apibacter muscae TaxID=2509004 RepID=A0A563DKB6_9FLAO|nr:translation elongation factor Ts [Apibacter muscae]TWP30620.1 elongation factor Ts [Apibacter muscae]TWP31456.1 elongation factor Ts [Apibacter muscae]